MSRNGQLFVFQCDTELRDLVDADVTRPHRDISSSSSDEEDVEPEQIKKRKGY